MKPKVNIRYNPNLDEVFKPFCLSLPKFKDYKIPTQEEIDKRIQEYKDAWSPIETVVFSTIEKKTHRKFPYSIVDVSVVSACHRQYSLAIVIGAHVKVGDFLNRFIHELVHKSGYGWTKEFTEKFGKEPKLLKNHIIVHALLEHIFTDVLKRPELIEINKKSCLKHETDEYTQAWKIVEEVGYKKILDTYVKKPRNLFLRFRPSLSYFKDRR
ncbi:MAG: hypothetical protein AAB534_02460 [Patescibacteria group bacterium]